MAHLQPRFKESYHSFNQKFKKLCSVGLWHSGLIAVSNEIKVKKNKNKIPKRVDLVNKQSDLSTSRKGSEKSKQ